MAIWIPPSENSTVLLYQVLGFRTIDFRTSIRKFPTKTEYSAWLPGVRCPATAEQNRHRNLPATWANLCACFPCSGWGYPSCRNRMDSHCTSRQGVQRGAAPLALGHPIGASSTLLAWGVQRGTAVPLAGGFQRRAEPSLAHDFPQESLVCYTFASG